MERHGTVAALPPLLGERCCRPLSLLHFSINAVAHDTLVCRRSAEGFTGHRTALLPELRRSPEYHRSPVSSAPSPSSCQSDAPPSKRTCPTSASRIWGTRGEEHFVVGVPCRYRWPCHARTCHGRSAPRHWVAASNRCAIWVGPAGRQTVRPVLLGLNMPAWTA
jgi:hypothetical protein